jgi:hypothetical protein
MVRAIRFRLLILFIHELQSNQQFRVEKDTFGELQVPSSRYWGAQTQRYALSMRTFSTITN